MLSYKQWKTLNESILPSFNLGLGQPTNLGIQSAFGLGLEESKKAAKKKAKKKMEKDKYDDEDEDDDLVEPSRKADDPDVEMMDDEDDDEDGDDDKKSCGNMSKKMMKSDEKSCGKMSKKKMWSDQDDEDDDDKEDDDDEDMDDEEDMDDKDDEDMDDKDDEDMDDEDMDDKDDEDMKGMGMKGMGMKGMKPKLTGKGGNASGSMGQEGPMFAKKKSKKMMLKGGQHKIDANKNGKIDAEDFKILKSKKKKDKVKAEAAEADWWNSVHSMLGDTPGTKYNSGCDDLFTTIDTENLTQAVRPEPGQPGWAPQTRIGK